MHNQILYSMWSIMHRDSIWTEIAFGQKKNHSEFLDEIWFVLESSIWEDSNKIWVGQKKCRIDTVYPIYDGRTPLEHILYERNFYRKLSKIVWNAQKPNFIWKWKKNMS